MKGRGLVVLAIIAIVIAMPFNVDLLSAFFPSRYDFFLCSQSVRQGTVTPTHFNVIADTSNLSPDSIQLFTYQLCHMYYNWPVSI